MTIRRREFLQGTSAALASLATPYVATAQSTSDTLSVISESGALIRRKDLRCQASGIRTPALACLIPDT